MNVSRPVDTTNPTQDDAQWAVSVLRSAWNNYRVACKGSLDPEDARLYNRDHSDIVAAIAIVEAVVKR